MKSGKYFTREIRETWRDLAVCFSPRCTRKKECSRWRENNTWLWSPNQQCVEIQAFDPPNLSCKKTQQVESDVNEHVQYVWVKPPWAMFTSCWALLNLNQSNLLKQHLKPVPNLWCVDPPGFPRGNCKEIFLMHGDIMIYIFGIWVRCILRRIICIVCADSCFGKQLRLIQLIKWNNVPLGKIVTPRNCWWHLVSVNHTWATAQTGLKETTTLLAVHACSLHQSR